MSIFTSPKKTVDSAIGALNTAIADLAEVAARELSEASYQEGVAQAAMASAQLAREEVTRAQAVSEKLRALIAA